MRKKTKLCSYLFLLMLYIALVPTMFGAQDSSFDFGDLDFDTLTIETTTGPAPVTKKEALSVKDDIDFSDLDFSVPEKELSPPSSLQPQEDESATRSAPVGLPITLPYLGKIILTPFTDPMTKKEGLMMTFASKSKRLVVGELVIDEGTIKIVDGVFSLTGRATLFGKSATFGLKEAIFGSKLSFKKIVLGLTFTQKPTIELLPGNIITLDEADIELIQGKPLEVIARTTLFSTPINVGFILTTTLVHAFVRFPHLILTELIPAMAQTALAKASLNNPTFTILNVWSSAKLPLTAKVSGNIDPGSLNVAGLELPQQLNLTGMLTAKTAQATINLPSLKIPLVGQLNDATIGIRTAPTGLDLIWEGNLVIGKTSLLSAIKIVKNDKGQQGIYINAPLTKNKTLSEILPDLKGPIFDGILFHEAHFIGSTITFIDPITGKTVERGLSFSAQVPLQGSLADAGKLMGATNQDFAMYGTLLPDNPRMSEFGISLSQGVPDPSASITLDEMRVAISGQPSLGIYANIMFRPSSSEQFSFIGNFDFKPTTANLTALMKGTWNNAFGFQGWDLISPSLGIAMLYGSPGLPTQMCGSGALKIKDYLDLELAFTADAALKDIAFEGKSNRAITYLHMAALVAQAMGISIPTPDIPGINFYDIHVKFATIATKACSKAISQGLIAKAKFNLFGKQGEIDAEISKAGLKAYGGIDPIEIGFQGTNIISITGRGKTRKPEVDIELTPARQIFRVTGILNLADMYTKEAFMAISPEGIEFNFEEALGGTRFMWEGKPLLLSRVHGISSGSINDADFTITILFEQYLKKYLLDSVEKAFTAAQKTVERDLTAAQQEINKIDTVIVDMRAGIKKAHNDVEIARKALSALDKANDDAQQTLAQAQESVDTLKTKIKTLNDWYDGLKEF